MRRLGLSRRRARRAVAVVVLVVTLAGLGVPAVPASAACGIPAALDLDGDCLSEATEETLGTDAWDPDTDGDLLSDAYERSMASDPLVANSTADRFVRALLTDLGIAVTPARVKQHTPAAATAEGRAALVHQLTYSDTYVRSVVDRFYQDTLGRAGDPGGVQYWTDLLTSKKLTTAQVAGYFYASEEYYANVGADLDAWLVDLYDALLLREPDAGGFSYWKGVARTYGRDAVAIPFYQGIETRWIRVRHLYQRFLDRHPDPAGEKYWADILLRTGDDVDLAVNLASSTEYSMRSAKRRWGTFGPEPPAVRIRRVSADSTNAAYTPSISEDGRYVAYRQAWADLHLWDRLTDEHVLIPVGHDGSPADGASWGAVVSGDGNHVAFLSEASNLVVDDTGFDFDVFVWDRRTRVTERVSVASDGTDANAPSDFSVPLDISHDGRFVVFRSHANNLAPGNDDEFADVFVRDRAAGITEQISQNTGDFDNHGFDPSISDDGRYVVFTSQNALSVDNDDGLMDVFLFDRSTGAMSTISTGQHPGVDGHSFPSQISGDGHHVVFSSESSQLVPGDTNEQADIFVWDRDSSAIQRVSMTTDGAQAIGGPSTWADVSRTGRYVSFTSTASNMTGGDNGATGVYLWDSLTDTVSLVSRSRSGERANGTHEWSTSAVTGDGRFVVFDSDATNLVPGDDNGVHDIFLWERSPG